MDINIINTKLGKIKILSKNGFIYKAYFVEAGEKNKINDYSIADDVKDYFDGVSTKLLSNLKLKGTGFQKKVWKSIQKIPYGETKTYSEIAVEIGFPNSCRAVANACGQNKIALFVPCHRVVGKNNIGGYKWTTQRKKWLLEFEKNNSKLEILYLQNTPT
ncbi:putative methylated-DNA-protein-cysteine methyltransferase [Tupanvirus soda lake]|uniref:methylated-DNA--[protein]-cysteine S-methyltransferase n=2 Tax=Tupanvirus TaxID=2094720 RepID=A0A6N1NX49_9VIRU|nr:putative methylated-DNA-protein-cysteine methyltransferase [Tupanvirus soda lake]QKU35856.1 putative methylated-DNA-protein-cysteine methyltransferase [Tupanvirus soda lake]